MTLYCPPGATGTYGAEVADLMEMAGRPLDVTQRAVVDAFASYGPGGLWHAAEATVVMPRQNGKSAGILLPMVLADLFLWTDTPDRIIWTAHLFKTSREAFGDFKRIITGCSSLSRKVKRIREANGEEGIELHSGAVLDFLARSKGGGRGLGGKRVVFDEALLLPSEAIGAILPTLAARPNVQIMYGSSAAKVESDHLRSLVKRGRSGTDPSLAFAEFAAPGSWESPGCAAPECRHVLGTPGCSLDSEDHWRAANPAVAAGRVKVERLRQLRGAMSPLEFGREFLSWHESGTEEGAAALPGWAALADPASEWSGRFTLAFDTSLGSTSASVALAARSGEKTQLEVVASRTGTSWLPEFLATAAGQYGGAIEVVANDYPSNEALLPALRDAGVEVRLIDAGDSASACAWIEQAVKDKTATHLGDPILTQALAGASVVNVGDGAWRWARRTSDSDITALWAVTLAGDALRTAPASVDFLML